MVTRLQMQQIIIAVSETIRELQEVPSGHVYNALLMRFPQLTSNEYQTAIESLTHAGLISQKHLVLRWIGPVLPSGEAT